MLADVLIKGVLFVADKKNLNQAFIKDAYRKMVKKEFNHYVKPWKKNSFHRINDLKRIQW